jgi:hypothetical protein
MVAIRSRATVVRSAFGIFYAPEGNIFNDLGENPLVLEFYYNQPNPAAIPTPAHLISAGFPAQRPPIDLYSRSILISDPRPTALASILPIDYPHFEMFYNGFQAKLEKRFSSGLTFRGAYLQQRHRTQPGHARGRRAGFSQRAS